MADRVSTKVSLVVQLIDDFNNRVIMGSGVRVWIEGEKPPIRKPEGYYVFTNLSNGQPQVLIESGTYEKQAVAVDLKAGGPYSLIKVRMVPGRAYVLPPQTTCVEGLARPGSRIRLFSREGAKPLKLLHDYACGGESKGEMGIYHPEDMELEGKCLAIENRDRTFWEFFRIQGKGREGGNYQLSEALTHDYKKIGTAIYLVYATNADETGRFFLPVFHLGGECGEFYCEASGTETVSAAVRLIKGTVNKVGLV